MLRKKQVVLNLMVIVALFVSSIGVLPAGAKVVADVPGQSAAAISPAQVGDKSATKPDRQPDQFEAVTDVKNLSNEPAIYMVRLSDPPLAAYTGGVAGLKATSPQATGERKLNVKSEAAQAYMAFLGNKHAQTIAATEQALKRPLVVVYQYYTANNGFAAYLTPVEAEIVAKQPGVIYIERDAESQLHTDVGPQWMAADTIWDGSATGTATKGEGVIVGVIDTGINHLSPSFADIGGDGYDHSNPWGSGVYVGYCVANPSFCNDKLIGAWAYIAATPEDADGHGSHTASTSAGNVVTATLTSTSGAVFTRTISGVAPHANVVMYAACCTNSALVAAVDQIITDTVDVVNYSIGSGSTSDPWTEFSSVGFLNARNAGIFIANSAGNDGPGFATLGSPSGAPWLTSVAASTHNRQFLSSVISATGGLITNTPPVLNGRGMSNGLGLHPVVYAGAAPYNDRYCAITAGIVYTNTIVVCDRGGGPGRVEKGVNVAARGAVGMIMVEIGPDGPGYFTTDSEQPIPAVYLTSGDGNLLKAWLATGTGHQVALSPTVMDVNASYGDVMASFSSRGENGSVLDLIAPSVTAPGVAIFAAYKTPEEFAVIQGTSMASPHVAGAAALMVALHPNWTPAEIQSALMSSSNTDVLKEDAVTPADPFDMGAGRVDLLAASQAGLVLNETNARYVAANPGTGGDPKTLNLASFGNAQCLSTCSWTRTLSSTMGSVVTWTSSVTSAAGITLTVTPSSFTLPAHGSQIITVTANVSALPNDIWAFGSVMLTPDVATTVAAHFPVAVKPSSGVLPTLVTVNTRRNAGSQEIIGLESIAATNLTMNSFGLAQATLTHRAIPQDATPSDPYDNLNDPGLFFITTTVSAGAKRLVAEITDSTSLDLDLYVHLDANSDGLPQETEQVCVSASGAVLEYCSMTNPAPGTYIVLVQNWDASAAITDTVTLATAVVPGSDNGNMTVTGPASVGQLVPYDLNLTWNTPTMVAGDRWYGAFALGTTPATPGNIGTIPVNIVRMADDVAKTVNTATANRGDTITYTITVLPNVTPADMDYVLTDTIPAGLTYVSGSVTATAGTVAVAGNQLTWSGTMGAQFRRYAMTTSNTDANCAMPLANSGAYVNLQLHGVNPQSTLSGNTKWYTAFSTGSQFNYWGANYTGINFTDDGMAFFGSTPGTTPWVNRDIPNVADPNNLLAMMWSDWEIVYATGPISRGVSLAAYGPPGGSTGPASAALIEYDDVQLYGDPSQTMDYEVAAWRSVDDAPGSPEIIFAYDNISLTHPIGVGTIGVENADGTDGTKYAYDDAALDTLTNGMAICFDWYQPSASPVTITYRATVDQNAAYGGVLTNQVLHNTDNPGSQVAEAAVDVTVNSVYAQLAVAHLAPFANTIAGTSVTVTLDSTPVLTDFVYGESTGYLSVLAGPHLVEIYPGASATPAITANVVLSENLSYSAVAIGDGPNQPLSLLALVDDTTPISGSAKIRIGHLAPFASGAALADVRFQDGTPIITNVLFSQVAPYLTLPAGAYDLKITAPGGTPTLIDPLPVTLNSNDILSVFATGDGGKQPLGAFAWPSNAAGSFLPLSARLAVAHLAPFANTLAGTSVTVTLDGTPVLPNVKYGDSTGYLTVAAGPHLVEIFPGASATPAITANVVLSPNLSYSAVAIGDGPNQPLSLLALLDDTTPVSGSAKIRIGHLAPFASGAALADVRFQDGTPVITNVPFSLVSPYLTLPAGVYDLKITAPGGTPTLIDPVPVTLNSNDILSVFATGDGVKQKLGVFAWPSNQPGFFLPLMKMLYLPLIHR